MSDFGFTFNALYRIETDALLELCHLIKGDEHHLPHNKDTLIRGVIIPFFKDAVKVGRYASKDEIMRAALVKVAKDMGIKCDDWNAAAEEWLTTEIKNSWIRAFRKRFDELSQAEREAILKEAQDNLATSAKAMGVSFVPAAGIFAGEMSGFGIYLATTTGLKALSVALGTTFPWAVYQGATTVLGIVLGPIGWAVAGSALMITGGGALRFLFKRRRLKLQVLVISLIIAIGDNPYKWFELPETASLAEVKQVYRAMIKLFHPDTVPAETPDWTRQQLNQLLLITIENYNRIKQHKNGVTS